jgi:hypothetical protein
MSNPYGETAERYYELGWRGILPLPYKQKKLPPAGHTGSTGTDPAYPDIAAWADGTGGPRNICLRLPDTVLGIDVDAYGEKTGAITIAEAEAEWGPLPPTWTSTSRNDDISGIRLYRIPAGLAWPGEVGPGVETIRRTHRYVVASPSIHPTTGDTYRWVNPAGVTAATALPDPDQLPLLPETWITGLTGGVAATETKRNTFAHNQAMLWLAGLDHSGDPTCTRMSQALNTSTGDLGAGSAHDAVCAGTARLLRLGDEGHRGTVTAIITLRDAFTAEVTSNTRPLAGKTRRSERDAEHEWTDALVSGINFISADPANVKTCDCDGGLTDTITGGDTTPPPREAPGADDPPTDPPTGPPTGPPTNPPTNEQYPQLVNGADFVLNAPAQPPALWGYGDAVLWAEGESLMIVGPPGVGKTTLTGQLLHGRLTGTHPLLDYGITPTTSRVLYLAMDRPAQIARSLRRHFTEDDRDLLADKLRVWQGPPPGDIAKQTVILKNLANLAGADTLIIDSIKDAAIGLSDDTIGAAYNQARQHALADGIQMIELHHIVKRGPNGAKPTQLADVYGSTWITSGAGSVILLWGAAGDPVVELTHLKQPAEDVGPMHLIHDHANGATTRHHDGTPTLTDLLHDNKLEGLTPQAAAYGLYTLTETPDANQTEKARYKLDAEVRTGRASVNKGTKGRGGKPSRYFPVGERHHEN